jgi:Protein of unknown function (DUF2817)
MMPDPTAYFPPDYPTARARFRSTAERLGWSLDAASVEGPDLTIDVAISPANGAERVLVVSSGLHGAEGPLGTAVQLAALDHWARRPPPPSVRCVFLHALNPYGYLHGRRADADNVDPNRNFLRPGEAFAGSPDTYRHFDALLNPQRPPGWADVLFPVRAYLGVLRYGLPALKQALVGGQYDFPKGLFFGGHRPCRSHMVLANRMRGWLGPAGSVVHFDFHTGLGPWGTDKLLMDTPMNPAHRGRLDRWFGPVTWEEDNAEGLSYLPRGGFGHWCVAQEFAPDYLYAVAEFGTYGGITMLSGLRAENQAHHWGRPDDAGTRWAKARLRELFVPASPAWRAKALARGVELVEQALGAVAAAPVLARGLQQ